MKKKPFLIFVFLVSLPFLFAAPSLHFTFYLYSDGTVSFKDFQLDSTPASQPSMDGENYILKAYPLEGPAFYTYTFRASKPIEGASQIPLSIPYDSSYALLVLKTPQNIYQKEIVCNFNRICEDQETPECMPDCSSDKKTVNSFPWTYLILGILVLAIFLFAYVEYKKIKARNESLPPSSPPPTLTN